MVAEKNITSLTACILAILLSFQLSAQGPPIFTDSPIMLGLEGRGIRTFGKYISKENAKIYMQPIAIPFNINAKWQIGGVVPLINVAPEDSDKRFGLSDIKIFTKYQLIQKDGKGKTFRTLIKLEETFPTGDNSDSPPLGSGAWQTTIGLVNGYVTTKFGIYGELAYNITSDGLPDNFLYNLAFGLPLLPQQYPPKQVNLFVEFNGNYFPDGGNNILFFSPGIQWIMGKKLLLETGIQMPIIEEVPEGNKTNFTYTLGTRVLIF